jgi:hypothetical protein
MKSWVEFHGNRTPSGKEDLSQRLPVKPDGIAGSSARTASRTGLSTDGGVFVDNHKVWTIHSVAYDNSVQAGRSTLVRYQFKIPENAKGPLSVSARVNYRHLRQSYMNNVLGKDHPAYPIVQLASRTRMLNIGENPVTGPDPSDNPDWMRWNNLGIAYLDQQQYDDAVYAFSEVVQLRP